MELDDLKALWKETDRRLQAMEPALRVSLSLNLRQAKAGALDRMRSKLRWVRLVLWYEISFAALVLLLLGSVSVRALGHPQVRAPGGGASSRRDRHPRRRGASVGGARSDRSRRSGGGNAAATRRARGRARPVQPLAAAVDAAAVGGAGGVVVPHALVGFDVYCAFGAAWVAGNFVFGVAVLAAAAWAGRRVGGAQLAVPSRARRRPHRAPGRRRIRAAGRRRGFRV